jgi:hypothetical protein
MGGLHFGEGKHSVDHWFNRAHFDGAVHGHERLCGADGNSLHVGTAGEDLAWIHLGGAAA